MSTGFFYDASICSRRRGAGKGLRLFSVYDWIRCFSSYTPIFFHSISLLMMCYGFMTILFCVYDMTIQDEMMFPKYLYPYSVDSYLDISAPTIANHIT